MQSTSFFDKVTFAARWFTSHEKWLSLWGDLLIMSVSYWQIHYTNDATVTGGSQPFVNSGW